MIHGRARKMNGIERHGPTLPFLECGTGHEKEIVNDGVNAGINGLNPFNLMCFAIVFT